MKKIVFLSICALSLTVMVSCGSTAPCGLAKTNKEVKQIDVEQQDIILVADSE